VSSQSSYPPISYEAIYDVIVLIYSAIVIRRKNIHLKHSLELHITRESLSIEINRIAPKKKSSIISKAKNIH